MEHPGPLQKSPPTLFSFSPSPPIDFSSLPCRHFPQDSSRRSPARSLWEDKPLSNNGIAAEASWLQSAWEQQQPTGSSDMDASEKNDVDDAGAAALCPSWDFWDDSSVLQHKRTAEFQSQPVGGNALGVEGDCAVTPCESRSSVKGSVAFSTASATRAIPFACKLDDAAAADRGVAFASLVAGADEGISGAGGMKGVSGGGFQVKIEMDEGLMSLKEPVVKGPQQANLENGFSHHDTTDKRGKGVQTAEESKGAVVVKNEIEQRGDSLGVTSPTGDASMGLKLGKRIYFEDGGVGVGGGGGVTSNNNWGGTKKQKASSPTGNTPRCQAEGCEDDFSNAKDYHKRHKVCETHAKAVKVKVRNVEQRFCQQCSRFHELSEFDEGKRSCRRRLDGHNRRRRKPPPEALSLFSAGSFSFLADDKQHVLNTTFLQHPCFLQNSALASSSLDQHPSSACQLRFPGNDSTHFLKFLRTPKDEPPLSASFPSLELHHFLQNNATQLGGHGLALSQPPPGSAVRLGPEALSPASQPSSGIAVSGRALSLLSSLGSPNNACPVSLNMSPRHPSPSLEQLLSENRASAAGQIVSTTDGQPCFLSVADKLIGMQTPPHSLTTSSGESPSGLDGEQRAPSAMASFEGRAVYTMLQENGFNSLQSADTQHGRPVLDLMQIPSPQSNQVSRPGQLEQGGLRFSDLDGLGLYAGMFGKQNIL